MHGKWWRIRGITVVLALLVAIVGTLPAAAAPAAQAAPQTWTVLVGGEAAGGAWQFMRFYPASITINAGDSIVWKINSGEFHAVNFPAPGEQPLSFILPQGQELVINPQVALPSGGPAYDGSAGAGSGLMGRAPGQALEFKLTFTKAGTFNYYCPIHSGVNPATGQLAGMLGQVIVQAAGSAYPKTQAQIDADAAAMLAADVKAAQADEPQIARVPAAQPGPNGTTIHTINIGYDTEMASYMRFAPADLTVQAGDTVVWQQASAVTPHTVTLLSGQKAPDLVLVQPQGNGPPRLTLNPAVVAPAGGARYDGTGFFNSGFLSGTQDPAPGPRSYSLTLTTPGQYVYVCMLHADMGMVGTITVLGGTSPGMPTTGHSDALWLLVALAGLALLLAGITLRRKLAAR